MPKKCRGMTNELYHSRGYLLYEGSSCDRKTAVWFYNQGITDPRYRRGIVSSLTLSILNCCSSNIYLTLLPNNLSPKRERSSRFLYFYPSAGGKTKRDKKAYKRAACGTEAVNRGYYTLHTLHRHEHRACLFIELHRQGYAINQSPISPQRASLVFLKDSSSKNWRCPIHKHSDP